MSPSGLPPKSPRQQSPESQPLSSQATTDEPPQPVHIPFGEQVKRGWDWVVFVWQMLRRVGGPIDLLLAFWTMITLLVTRLLVQLGFTKK